MYAYCVFVYNCVYVRVCISVLVLSKCMYASSCVRACVRVYLRACKFVCQFEHKCVGARTYVCRCVCSCMRIYISASERTINMCVVKVRLQIPVTPQS